MSHPNENGEIGYVRFSPLYHVKAMVRAFRQWEEQRYLRWWMKRYYKG